MDELMIFYRDINLKKDIEVNYFKGQILKDKSSLDMTSHRGGPFTSHRYVIISNRYVKNSKINDEDEDWQMYTIGKNESFRITEIIVIKRITYYLLVHLNAINEKELKQMIKKAKKQIKEDSKMKINPNVATISWLEMCQHPIGIYPNKE